MNVQRLLRRFLLLAAISLLFSGCKNSDTDGLKATIEQQKQEIAQLKQRLEAESLQADALQSAVNQATVYEWVGPLRWMPIWDDLALQVGKEVREKRGWAPDWRAWALLGALYIVAAGAVGAAVGAIVGAGVGVMRKMQQLSALKRETREQERAIREQERALGEIQPQLERLRRLEEEVEAAREKLHETTRQIEEAERRQAKAREEIQALEQRKRDESEREKEKIRAEYRRTSESNTN
jgi:septal ring factor EnvC (AmiA/AmiB activator)